jgi:hypothetical protein
MQGNGFAKVSGTTAKVLLGVVLAVGIAGCRKDSDETAATPTPGGTGSTPATGGATGGNGGGTPISNRAPTISGTPVTMAKTTVTYSFQPVARDADGDKLTFSINGKPDWATFNAVTGRLEGRPPDSSTGSFASVQISVSDGTHTVQMDPFTISVVQPAIGSAELAWQPPTSNEDGSALVNLSGYVIRYGQDPGSLDQSVRINNAGTTAYVVDNLVEGTWYFSLSSVDSNGIESRPTGFVSRTIG